MKKTIALLAVTILAVTMFVSVGSACTIHEYQNYKETLDCCGCWDRNHYELPPDYVLAEWDTIFGPDCGSDSGKVVHYTEYSCRAILFDCDGTWCHYGPPIDWRR